MDLDCSSISMDRHTLATELSWAMLFQVRDNPTLMLNVGPLSFLSLEINFDSRDKHQQGPEESRESAEKQHRCLGLEDRRWT